MKKEQLIKLLKVFAVPALLTVLGLILLTRPDSATALVVKIIGWIFLAVGACSVLDILLSREFHRVGKWIVAAACLAVGGYIAANPLVLAKVLGRCLGLILAVRGISDVISAIKRKNDGLSWQSALILAVVTLAAGLILALLPLTLTRTIIRLCGLVVTIIGVVNLMEKFREVKQLGDGKADIIDADE